MGAPNRIDIANQVARATFGRTDGITDPSDRHKFVAALVDTLHMLPGDDSWRWGRKSRASHAGPLSDDTLGYWLGGYPPPSGPTDGQLDAVDVITSWGAVAWQCPPENQNIFAMWYPVEKPVPGNGGSGGGEQPSDGLEELFRELLEDSEKIAERLENVVDVGRALAERLEPLRELGNLAARVGELKVVLEQLKSDGLRLRVR